MIACRCREHSGIIRSRSFGVALVPEVLGWHGREVCQNTADFSLRFKVMTAPIQRDGGQVRTLPPPPLRVLRVTGPDRHAFLQAQLTQDLRLLHPGIALRYAWSDAQGRVLAAGEAFEWRDAIWMTVPAALCESIAGRLRRYVLRMEVNVDIAETPLTAWQLDAAEGGESAEQPSPAGHLSFSAGHDGWLLRVHGDVVLGGDSKLPDGLSGIPLDANGWTLGDIRAGFARAAPGHGPFTPQMLNLDLCGALSFDKGCYPGQEIITRIRHRGQVKRRLYRCGSNAAEIPQAGSALLDAEGQQAGTIVASASSREGVEMLAVIRMEATAGPLLTDTEARQAISILPLPYPIPTA